MLCDILFVSLMQLTEVQIKEEVSSVDDDDPNVESWLPESDVESNTSSLSFDVTQTKTQLSWAKSVPHRTRKKIKLEENILKLEENNLKLEENNLLKKKKQRWSTLSETQDKKTAQPLKKKKRVCLRRFLPRHSKGSPSGAFVHCNICGSGFEKYSALLLHRKSCHKISPESQKSRLARNLWRRSVFAKLNGPSLAGDSTGNNLSEASHTMKWLCPHCHRQFSRSCKCRAHILKCHPRKFKKLSLRRTKLHPLCSVSSGVFKCPSCKQPFVHLSCLKTHHAANHRRMKDPDCTDILRGKQKVRPDWHCQQNDCSAVCKSAAQVKKHMATEHPWVLFSCPDCKFMSQDERIFLRYFI